MHSRSMVGWLLVGASLALTADASAQTRLFTHDGQHDNLGYGYNVTGMGDIDGDGVPDYAVAAYLDDGHVDVFSGRTGGLIYGLEPDAPGVCFGMGIDTIQDIDGDGVRELIVGAPRATPEGQTGASGVAYLLSGATGAEIYKWDGAINKQRFGIAVANAGDVDGDGQDDIVIGGPWDDTNFFEHGSATVFSSATGEMIFKLLGRHAQDWFGWDVASAGDITGDGKSEVLVGAPRRFYGDPPPLHTPGEALVLHAVTGQVMREYAGDSENDFFGTSVALLPDVNGDGVDEHVIGVPRYREHGVEMGQVRVYDGATGTLWWSAEGEVDSRLGTSVAHVGDWDRDGVADVVAGACYCHNINFSDPSEAGYFEVRSGVDGSRLAQVYGEPGTGFAFSVAGIGDVNGDELPDVLTGNHFDDALGESTGSGAVTSNASLEMKYSDQQSYAKQTVSLSSPLPQVFDLSMNIGMAGNDFILVGSMTGMQPGLVVHGVPIPLNIDVYTKLTLAQAGMSWFVGGMGTLDAAGDAQPFLLWVIQPIPPAAIGLTAHHAAVILDSNGKVVGASNPLPTTFVP